MVEYDGTDFCGWQRQNNGPTVQAAIEAAIARLTQAPATVAGAGRTDAGVHAQGQVASFLSDTRLRPDQLRRGLNALLPRSIAVVAVDEVPLDFDPRRHALGKLYRYRIWNAEVRSPFDARTSWHIGGTLEEARMDHAAQVLVGEHDYSAFRASDCERINTVRRITRLDVRRPLPALVTVEVEATAFLKNMVRILVGTLADVGRGRTSADDVARILASGDRTLAGPTAPPEGLALVRVDYELPSVTTPRR